CNDLIIDEYGVLWFAVCDSIVFSTDSGKTFIKRISPCINRLAEHQTILSGCADNFYMNNTSDSGMSWKSFSIIDGNSEPSNLHAIAYSSAFVGVVVGDWCYYYGLVPPHQWPASAFKTTADSGKTWIKPSEQWNTRLHGGQLYAAQSIDSLSFIIAGDSSYIAKVIVSKSNSGYDIQNIKVLKPSRNNDTIFDDVHFFSVNRGFVIGSFGTIFYTENEGKAWSKIPSPNNSTLLRITFTDSTNGWIVGDNGVILHTNNGGWLGGTSEVKEAQNRNNGRNSLAYDLDQDEWILRTQDHLTSNPVVSIYSLLGVQVLQNIQCNEISEGVYSLPKTKLQNGFYIARFQSGVRSFSLPLIQK
ncbi:MAG: WD40/YVTN/BNR-like repeat-containing protein, partial [Candidatus Kapaibacterium sp.]